jgi:hypothetical protein
VHARLSRKRREDRIAAAALATLVGAFAFSAVPAWPATDPLPEANGIVGMPPGGDRITVHAGSLAADQRRSSPVVVIRLVAGRLRSASV